VLTRYKKSKSLTAL